MVQIVGILGFKGSGKDTVGDYLVRQHGFVLESFANPLKDVVSAIFGWDRNLVEGSTTESRTWREIPDTWWEDKLNWSSHPASHLGRFTPRLALQLIGTNVLREHFDDGLWIKSLEARLQSHDRVVITDCRFSNECKLVRQNGGFLVQVQRGPQPEWLPFAYGAASNVPGAREYMFKNFPKAHISEWAWLGESSYLIDNNGTLDQLYEKMRCLLKNHYSKS
jgi:hypothetical protein